MIKIEIIDEKILKLLNSKAEISAKALDLLKQQEEIEKQLNKCQAMHARIDEKVKPKIELLMKDVELKEFEQLSAVRQNPDDKKWYIEIVDRLEEFKLIFKEKEKNIKK
jgi:hypothetical protein